MFHIEILKITLLFNVAVALESVIELEHIQDAFALPHGYFDSDPRNHSSKVMCSIRLDSVLRPGLAKYTLESSKEERRALSDHCTHIVFRRFQMSSQTNEIVIAKNYDLIARLSPLIHQEYPHLKQIIEIWVDVKGSFEEMTSVLSHMVSTEEKQQKFIASLIRITRELNVSGVHFTLHFNFHYKDNNLHNFLTKLKSEFGNNDLLLSTEIPGYSVEYIDANLKHLTYSSRSFDFVVVRGFDFYSDNITSHNSPLKQCIACWWSEDSSIENTLAHVIFNKRVRPGQIILKVPFGGKSFALKKKLFFDGLYQLKNVTHSFSSPLLHKPTDWTYFEICYAVFLKNESWTMYWDNDPKVPFMKLGDNWITFDNPRSVYEKAAHALKLGLGGIATQNSDFDDFRNMCSVGSNPLMKSIRYALTKYEQTRGSLLCPILEAQKRKNRFIYTGRKLRIPFVTMQPIGKLVTQDDNVEMKCIVENDEEDIPVIEWLQVNDADEEIGIISGKDDILISFFDSRHECLPYYKTTSILNVKRMEDRFSGRFICRAKTNGGYAQATAYLNCSNCEDEKLDHKPEINPRGLSLWWIFLWISFGILLIFLLALLLMKLLRNRRGLTSAEISMFFNGRPSLVALSTEENSELAEYLPYDAAKYEIPDDDYLIDKDCILGTGNFGIVYKGRIREAVVAVKSVKPESDKMYLKSLLSELKILMHLGKHPNVVVMLAARTKQLSIGILYIFVEYCAYGNLNQFLRDSRKIFLSQDSGEHLLLHDKKRDEDQVDDCITLDNLLRWSYQIATALQHLRQKRIIHGDLATRNVLIFERNLVKVTDFGLSRKQYSYADYVKKGQEPLPWRWMAIESLRDMTFSHQSDIWSFGITIWEIFSLGEIPYPGTVYTVEFIKTLKEGHRLSSPEHATSQIYTLMKSCWDTDPQLRPDINDIEQEINNIISNNPFSTEYCIIAE